MQANSLRSFKGSSTPNARRSNADHAAAWPFVAPGKRRQHHTHA